jgi:hypothetical protein
MRNEGGDLALEIAGQVVVLKQDAVLELLMPALPLEHPPGHPQVDFGEAIGIIGGVQRPESTSLLLACRTRTPLRGRLPRRNERHGGQVSSGGE